MDVLKNSAIRIFLSIGNVYELLNFVVLIARVSSRSMTALVEAVGIRGGSFVGFHSRLAQDINLIPTDRQGPPNRRLGLQFRKSLIYNETFDSKWTLSI